MSLLTVIAIAFVVIVLGAVFGFALFCVAGRADREAEDGLRRERERREALNRISGGAGSGWRGR